MPLDLQPLSEGTETLTPLVEDEETGTFPAEDLYPANDLYPEEDTGLRLNILTED